MRRLVGQYEALPQVSGIYEGLLVCQKQPDGSRQNVSLVGGKAYCRSGTRMCELENFDVEERNEAMIVIHWTCMKHLKAVSASYTKEFGREKDKVRIQRIESVCDRIRESPSEELRLLEAMSCRPAANLINRGLLRSNGSLVSFIKWLARSMLSLDNELSHKGCGRISFSYNQWISIVTEMLAHFPPVSCYSGQTLIFQTNVGPFQLSLDRADTRFNHAENFLHGSLFPVTLLEQYMSSQSPLLSDKLSFLSTYAACFGWRNDKTVQKNVPRRVFSDRDCRVLIAKWQSSKGNFDLEGRSRQAMPLGKYLDWWSKDFYSVISHIVPTLDDSNDDSYKPTVLSSPWLASADVHADKSTYLPENMDKVLLIENLAKLAYYRRDIGNAKRERRYYFLPALKTDMLKSVQTIQQARGRHIYTEISIDLLRLTQDLQHTKEISGGCWATDFLARKVAHFRVKFPHLSWGEPSLPSSAVVLDVSLDDNEDCYVESGDEQDDDDE